MPDKWVLSQKFCHFSTIILKFLAPKVDTHHTTHFQLSFNAIIINIISMSGNFSGDHNIFRHMQKKITITLKFCQILSKLECNFYHHIFWPEINEWVPFNVLPFKRDTPLRGWALIQAMRSYKKARLFLGACLLLFVNLWWEDLFLGDTFYDIQGCCFSFACLFLKRQKGDFCQK